MSVSCVQRQEKVTRVKKEKKDKTLQRCESEDMVSESTKDGRIEKCSKCGNEWGHDKISMLNMCRAKDALRFRMAQLVEVETVE